MKEQRELSTRRRVVRRPDLGLAAGVAAGVAEAYDLDPWLVRVVLLGAAFVNGFGIVVYGLCWLLLPAGVVPPAVDPEA